MIYYSEKIPDAKSFINLTESVGWGHSAVAVVDEALQNTLYVICAMQDNKLIGFGRLIGDGAMFLYIQDVMVLPEFQRKKIGTQIMKYLLDKVAELKKRNPNIRTYLGASKGKESFYKKIGFVTRTEAGLGDGMVMF